MEPRISRAIGAQLLAERACRFSVWAPRARHVEVHLLAPHKRYIPLESLEYGYFSADIEGVEAGTRYFYRIDGEKERPDPASRAQPEGVHGPSQVVDLSFPWEDQRWKGLSLEEMILYEAHVGTFTSEGTFEAIIPRLPYLKELGVNALELLPVAQFPGERNWGYDGVQLFAVQNSYGGVQGLQRLVNAAHQQGMALVLDVVYNHLGPEGNYLWDYGSYFTERYRTFWGDAINFDGSLSDPVRDFFIRNALYWFRDLHIDALRLDALHAIFDASAYPFLAELAEEVEQCAQKEGRTMQLIAESDLNDPRLILPREKGGFALDAQWCDDFHHALHTLLTGEEEHYYQDFGQVEHLARAYRQGYVYAGHYSSFRERRHGRSPQGISASQLVIFAQNHDQVGNRMLGERLATLVDLERLKLAAATTLLAPFVPLLFMGEEYGETHPFLYFVSHSDSELIANVREGRQREFEAFYHDGDFPDPQEEATFLQSKIDPSLRQQEPQRTLWRFYQVLLRLRQNHPVLSSRELEEQEIDWEEEGKWLWVRRRRGQEQTLLLLHFGSQPLAWERPWPEGLWCKQLDSASSLWRGAGETVPSQVSGNTFALLPPWSATLFAPQGSFLEVET